MSGPLECVCPVRYRKTCPQWKWQCVNSVVSVVGIVFQKIPHAVSDIDADW